MEPSLLGSSEVNLIRRIHIIDVVAGTLLSVVAVE